MWELNPIIRNQLELVEWVNRKLTPADSNGIADCVANLTIELAEQAAISFGEAWGPILVPIHSIFNLARTYEKQQS